MKKLTFAVAVLVVIGAAVFLWGRAAWSQQGADAAGTQVVRVARRDIARFVKATGVIRPRVGAEVRVGSRASGVIKRLYVRIGDRVTKDQVLAELDDRDLLARRNEATANVLRAEADLAFARADLDRKRDLSANGVIARSDLDIAERAANVSEQ